jgi:hypothetical protein
MQIFISFKTDSSLNEATQVERELKNRGHKVDVLKHRLTDPIEEVVKRLKNAELLITLIAPETCNSHWVVAEQLVAEFAGIPKIAILKDEFSFAPETLRENTAVLAYPTLEKTKFRLFDIFPSRKMSIKSWKKAKKDISIFRQREDNSIPAPPINRKNPFNRLLHFLGFFFLAAAYVLGFVFPNLLHMLLHMAKGADISIFSSPEFMKVQGKIFLYWQIAFWLILFHNRHRRLAYPLWCLWLFRDYIPSWISTGKRGLRKRMQLIMNILINSPGNKEFWKLEKARRLEDKSDTPHYRKRIFDLIAKDEFTAIGKAKLIKKEQNARTKRMANFSYKGLNFAFPFLLLGLVLEFLSVVQEGLIPFGGTILFMIAIFLGAPGFYSFLPSARARRMALLFFFNLLVGYFILKSAAKIGTEWKKILTFVVGALFMVYGLWGYLKLIKPVLEDIFLSTKKNPDDISINRRQEKNVTSRKGGEKN